ncbi:TBC1 domain family member 5 homolog A-like [Panonychus citri]|uniref:TBC1 domain family member 5 homolog A-like n=1 Tax=Panonychus citri TaxID=50023 RepID=UPI00230817D4|nr:TBC1 domain family member 5 homolog A-like [Panonychus citri]
MSDPLVTSTETKSLKDRLTFNWPTRGSSSSSVFGKPTQVIAPFSETKLPVKQRVVFPSDRLPANCSNNNNSNGQLVQGNNNQRYDSDDCWESMANVFRNPSPSPPPSGSWAYGSDKSNDNNNKRRRNDQNSKSKNNYNSRRNGDGEFSGYNETNSNRYSNCSDDRNKFQKKRRNDDWDWDSNRNNGPDSSSDRRNVDWTMGFNENDYSNCYSNSNSRKDNYPKKSIATQTDSSTFRSVGVQTDPCDDLIPVERQQQQQLEFYSNQSTGIVAKFNWPNQNGQSAITNDQQSRPLIIPSDLINVANRDPRVARRAANMKQ